MATNNIFEISSPTNKVQFGGYFILLKFLKFYSLLVLGRKKKLSDFVCESTIYRKIIQLLVKLGSKSPKITN